MAERYSSVTGLAEPEEVPSLEVTDGVLGILGVQPAAGRLFNSRDTAPGAPETVVLSNGYWRRRFAGDLSAIGRRINIDSRPREIIGVLPADFRFQNRKFSFVLPFQFDRAKTKLGNFSYQGVARLKPGVSLAQATADVAGCCRL